jgi:DNA-binding transcriptional ArsR family regulator
MDNKFSDKESAELFKIFTEEIRLKIITQLIKGEMHVIEIAKTLGIVQPLVSHHLRILKEKKIVKAVRKGNKMIYSLNDEIRSKIHHDGDYVLDLGCCEIKFKN